MKESLDTSQIMMDELTQASALIAQAIDLINRGDLNNAWQLFSKVSSLGLRVELNANRLETTLRLAAEEGKNKGAWHLSPLPIYYKHNQTASEAVLKYQKLCLLQ